MQPNFWQRGLVKKAIHILDAEIEAADVVRQEQITKHVQRWLELDRSEVLDCIDEWLRKLETASAEWRVCDQSLIIGEILLELGKVIKKWSDPQLCSSLEIKTGVLRRKPTVPIEKQLLKRVENLTALDLFPVQKKHLVSLHSQRLFRLKNIDRLRELVLSNEEQRVCSKLYPRTTAWFFGAKSKVVGKVFEQELELLSEKHKIFLVGKSSRQAKVERCNTLLLLGSFEYTGWPQDVVDFSRDEVRVPVMSSKNEKQSFLADVIQADRKNRNELWLQLDRDNWPLYKAIDRVRTTWRRNTGSYGIAFALAMDCPVVMNLTYNEGGNTLLGAVKGGEAGAIIGFDSVAATRAILERDLDRDVDDEMLRDAFRIDYGIKHIWFVEQPGDFHLDMSMAFVAPGVVVLNDSIAAHERFRGDFIRLSEADGIADKEQFSKALGEVLELAKLRASLEDVVAKQLLEFGFEVHRVPGRYFFKRVADDFAVELMNMFNFVTATISSEERLVVALGIIEDSDVPYREDFLKMLELGGEGPDHVEFLSLEVSQMLLERKGGLSCSIKTIE